MIVEAVARLVPGVLGCEASTVDESFSAGRLEYPQWTRPPTFRGLAVPEVLLSGNHAEVEKWRRLESLRRTAERGARICWPRHPLTEDGAGLAEREAPASAASRRPGKADEAKGLPAQRLLTMRRLPRSKYAP